MGFFDILGGLGGIAGGIADITSTMMNYKAQKQMMEYQKEVQEKTWEREDNATQRRVKDLIAAGLSPTLAAGNAAASSAPIHVDTPQMGDVGSKIRGVLETAAIAQQRHQADAQIELMKSEAEQTKANAAKTAEEARGLQRENDINNFYDKLASDLTPEYMGRSGEALLRKEKALYGKGVLGSQNAKADYEATLEGVNLAERIRNIGIAKALGVRSDLTGGEAANLQQLFSFGNNQTRIPPPKPFEFITPWKGAQQDYEMWVERLKRGRK